MGSVRGGPRRPNTTAYFVALAGILLLLLLLCCYFLYFCVRKVKELTSEDSPLNSDPRAPRPARDTRSAAYPVQPVVREGATAMAALCRQLPAGGKGDTVFPAATPTAPAAPPLPAAPAGPGAPPAGPDGPPAVPGAGKPPPAPAACARLDAAAAS